MDRHLDQFYFLQSKTTKLGSSFPALSQSETDNIEKFHSGITGYIPTPLVRLKALAAEINVESFMVKDESRRFDCNAFKVLGGSYAMAKCLLAEIGMTPDKESFAFLRSEEGKQKIGRHTFVTTTDGNHGRGVAWAAKKFDQDAYVYMPKGTAQERLENILALGAYAEITDMSYDDTVKYTKKLAEEKGWILIQDTSWDGYETIPLSIMQGYSTIAKEIVNDLNAYGDALPTHLFLQAGVGCFAGAIAGYFAENFKEKMPKVVLVEPVSADCHYRTALANDGSLHFVTKDMKSMMAGLCCGEPCTISWNILKDTVSAFVTVSDDYSAYGMRLLAHPEGRDQVIVSGESGAVTAGVAAKLMEDEYLADYRYALGLDEHSRILVISTEGDTDKENYRKITAEEI